MKEHTVQYMYTVRVEKCKCHCIFLSVQLETLDGVLSIAIGNPYKGPFRLTYKTVRHQPSDKIRLTKITKYCHICQI